MPDKSLMPGGIDRRNFLMAGAAGAAAIAASGLGANTASAATIVPGKTLKTNATKGGKRVIIINDALLQIGPPLARNFAKQGYNLVIAQPEKGLVKECEGYGAKVIVVPGIEQHGPNDERRPDSTQKLVDAAMKEFGGFDSAYIRTAEHMPRRYIRYKCREHAANCTKVTSSRWSMHFNPCCRPSWTRAPDRLSS